jgi:hypothetical protein
VRRDLRLKVKRLLQPGIDTMGYTAASYVELKSQANDLASTLISFDKAPTTPADMRLLAAVRLLQPIAVDHSRLTRVGGEGDGGYVMLADTPASVAVSIGVGPDVSWDSAVAAQGTPVHMFDHTVRRLPGRVPGGSFHRLGVGPCDEGPLRTLSSIMGISGVSPGSSALLKMDVEGAEWSSLAACHPGLLGAFDQIVMELHDLDRLLGADSGADVLTALRLLSDEHLPIHVHANNYARVVRFGSYWFPKAVEVSWVHRRHLTAAAPAGSLARHLDRPCDPRVTDVDLSAITRIHTHGATPTP